MARSHRALLAAALLGALALARAQTIPPGSPLLPDSVVPAPDGTFVVTYTVNVTLSYGAPSCFARPIILVNGIFEPKIMINQGDTITVRLVNNLPYDYPSVAEGISIHYHGLHMAGPAAWLDGVSYIGLCPVTAGQTFAYQFKVPDPPGTYLWHDHSAGFKADGLQGPFIVLPPRAPPPTPTPGQPGQPPVMPPPSLPDVWQYDGEHTLFLSDWYHATTNSMFFRLNEPFDAGKVTNDSGSWNWVGNPQAILINGRGYYGDCQLFAPAGGSTAPPACAPSVFTVAAGRSVQQPWASNNNPGCTHSQFDVEAGKTYRLRVVNAGTLVYMTVCFDSHNVSVVALDGIPVAPVPVTCLDVNSGQRVDVLLTANQPASNYWITVASQFRPGAPAGYVVLRYAGAANASTFPTTPAPQPANITVQTTPFVLDSRLAAANVTNPALRRYLRPGQSTLAPPPTLSKLVVINLSQPLIENGQLRWALNNVASPRTPPCTPLMQLTSKDPKYLDKRAVPASAVNGTGAGPNVGVSQGGKSRDSPVYLDGTSPVPVYPSVGLHIVELEGGEVVDVVVNNRPANSYNGDYRPDVGATRTAVEQHPFHLHGHRFWVLARGTNGTYDPAQHAASLNTANPVLRDTVTIAAGGWAYLRFVADNPGIWPFHCHILPHVFMGQQLFFASALSKVAAPPAQQPKCPKTCRYNFAPYTKSYIRAKWGMSGWELPW